MSGEKYPAKLVEKIARAICDGFAGELGHYDNWGKENRKDWVMVAIAALDAIPYAAMKEALYAAETVMMIVEPRSHKSEYLETLGKVRAALRAADGEET